MKRLYALAAFLAASLLFLVQPMVAQRLLPIVGGTPQVWTVCMLFFQAVLLVGYLYAHVATTRLSPRAQAAVHVIVVALAGVSLPIALPAVLAMPASDAPVFWLLGVLAVMVGLPFFAVSSMGPTLQRWFSQTSHAEAGDPYFLYAASNAGSAVGLLAYPVVLQRVATLGEQSLVWTIGYAALAAVVIACGLAMLRRPAPNRPDGTAPEHETITWRRRAWWVFLAFVPSSLMLGVTQHVTTDVAAVPMLWVVPLLLYLVTMTMAFSRRFGVSARRTGAVLPVLGVALGVLLVMNYRGSMMLSLCVHGAFFVVAALLCHQRLADDRPSAARLTEYFLLVSLGGVLGGIFNGLAAPLLFDRLIEYPIAIGLAMLACPGLGAALRDRRLPAAGAHAGLAVGVLTAACASLYLARGGVVLLTERTLFGSHQVVAQDRPKFANAGGWHRLAHGTTVHGVQARFDLAPTPADPRERAYVQYLRGVPTTYFHPTGPLGDAFRLAQRDGPVTVGVIGLGAGTMAAYARPGDTMMFFEIDPAVIRIAHEPAYFTYISDAVSRGARVGTVVGDGRLTIAGRPPGEAFDLFIIDAFTSDAIPVHLLTLEAFRDVYLPRLREHGVIAINVSNRHLDLQPVLASIAHELGLASYGRVDRCLPEQKAEAKEDSIWVAMARVPADLGVIVSSPGWARLKPDTRRPWTDDFSDILSVFSPRGVGR